MTFGTWGGNPTKAALDAEAAAHRLRTSFIALETVLERKQNFNPNQPRRPKGTPIGGQWAPGTPGWIRGPSPIEFGADLAAGATRVNAFVARHHKTVTRMLGAVQWVGGGVEMIGSIPVGVAGAAASETGVGVLGMILAGWMAKNGHDNLRTGWRALLTGDPQNTDLYRTFRRIGLNDGQANAAEILLSGGGGIAAARIGRGALAKAAEAELVRRTARAFDPGLALEVRSAGRSLWLDADIRSRGDAWEAFDALRTGYRRFPHAPVFDQISQDGRIAVSNKTLDLYRETYLRNDGRALFATLKRYIDAASIYTPRNPRTGELLVLTQRRIHLLLRSGDSVPGQALQLVAAEQYAKSQGVLLMVEYAR